MISTIIWCWKHGDDWWKFIWTIPTMLFVTILFALVWSNYGLQTFFFEERVDRPLPENNRSISLFIKFKVCVKIVISCWIRPKKIWEKTVFIGWFAFPINLVDGINGSKKGRYSTMHAEVHSIHCRSNWKLVECFHYFIVKINVVQIYALLSEIELFSNLSALVVSSQKIDVIWISLFQSIQKKYYFWAKAPSVYIITQE